MPHDPTPEGRVSRLIRGGSEALGVVGAVVSAPVRFVRWLAEWLRWWTASGARRFTFIVLLSIGTMAILGTRTMRLELRFQQAEVKRAEIAETYYIPPPIALRMMSLGHESFVGDMLFLRANMYFISHLFADRIFAWLDAYVQAIVAVDPTNPRVYEWASQAVKFGQLISNEALEKSNDYARAGIESFPDHWRFYFDIGFNYYIEWKPTSEAESEEMRQKALPYFSLASALPGSELDPNFVSELYLQDNDVEMALFHTYLRYWEASDRERESLRGRITRYESTAVARQLSELEAQWKERLPYIPIGLFELLGPPPEIRVPTSWADTALTQEEGT